MTDSPIRLEHVEACRVEVPFRRPFVTANGEYARRSSWILRLRDADGREAFGEASLDPAASPAAEEMLARAVRDAVTGATMGRLPSAAELAGLGEPGRALRAAIDGALWWLRATRAMAGGSAGRVAAVPVNATVDFGGPKAAAEAASQAVSVGYSTLKVKAGAERETEVLVERIRAVRTAVGPSVRLRIDVNGAWDLRTAAERLDAIARFGIEYVEQPLPAWDLAGHAELRATCGVPVALDESIGSENAAAEALTAGAADVLVVKPTRVGGPEVVAAIGARAARAGVPVVVSTFFETGIGIHAALRIATDLPVVGAGPAHGLATAGILAHDLLAAAIPVVDGRMSVPTGLAIDEDALRRYTRETAVAGG